MRPGEDVTIALDVAATISIATAATTSPPKQGRQLTSSEMIDRLESWIDEFPITSIEDGLAEDDWDGWRELTARLGSAVKLVGDDLFATNAARCSGGSMNRSPTRAGQGQPDRHADRNVRHDAARPMRHGYALRRLRPQRRDRRRLPSPTWPSARRPSQIKIGSIVRSERLAKYNRLLRIAEQL